MIGLRVSWIQVSFCSFLIRNIFVYTAQVLDLGLAQSYLLYSGPSSFCCAATLKSSHVMKNHFND